FAILGSLANGVGIGATISLTGKFFLHMLPGDQPVRMLQIPQVGPAIVTPVTLTVNTVGVTDYEATLHTADSPDGASPYLAGATLVADGHPLPLLKISALTLGKASDQYMVDFIIGGKDTSD